MSHRPAALKPPSKVVRPSGLAQPRVSAPGAGSKLPTPGDAAQGKSNFDKAASSTSSGSGDPLPVTDSLPPTDKISSQPQMPPPVAASKSADNFKFGDRVWVSGTKSGCIGFIGETQFAPGLWAGVILDEPLGKNDGSVQGVRYFACEPMHGLFSKLNNLSSCQMQSESPAGNVAQVLPTPNQPSVGMTETLPETPVAASRESSQIDVSVKRSSESLESPSASSAAAAAATSVQPSSTAVGSSIARPSGLARISRHGSAVNVNQSGVAPGASQSVGVSPVEAAAKLHNLRVGERVIVGGNKLGVLRYVGSTHFAKGEWAGVELDEPIGKNDGLVEGRRYFQCKPLYGLFAPIAKVTSAPGTPVPAATVTPITPKSRSSATQLVQNVAAAESRSTTELAPVTRNRAGSQESLSSMSSVTSSASRSREKGTKGKSLVQPSPQATASALQKALKEKEEHIEQLLMERDLERSEIARMAAHADEVEAKFVSMAQQHEKLRLENDEKVREVQQTVEKLEQEKIQLRNRLEEEKRKAEDLQFSLEEAAIDKGDFKVQVERDARKFKELENQLRVQTEFAENLQQQLNSMLAEKSSEKQLSAVSETNISPMTSEQISDLTLQLEASRTQTALLESQKEHLQVEVERLKTDLDARNGEIEQLHSRVQSTEKTTVELQAKLAEMALAESVSEEKQSTAAAEMNSMASDEINDLTVKLEASQTQTALLETKNESLNAKLDHLKLELDERNNQIACLQSSVESSQQATAQLQAKVAELTLASETSEEERSVAAAQLNSSASEQTSILTQKLEAAQTQVTALESDKKRLQEELENLKTELDGQKAHVTQLQSVVDTSEKSAVELQAKVAELQKDLDDSKLMLQEQQTDLMTKLAAGETSSTNLSTEIQQLKSLVSDLQHQLQCSFDKARSLEEDKSKLERQLLELTNSSGDSSQQMTLLNTELRERDRSITGLQETLAELKSKHDALTEGSEADRLKIAASEKQVADLKIELETLHSQLKEKEIAEKTSSKELMDKISSLTEHNERLETELTELKAGLAGMTEDADGRLKLIESLKSQVDALQTQNSELGDSKGELLKLIESTQSEVQCLTTERDCLTLEVKSAGEKLKLVETENQQRVNGLEAENSKLQAQNVELEKQLQDSEQRQLKAVAEAQRKIDSLQQKLEADKVVGELKPTVDTVNNVDMKVDANANVASVSNECFQKLQEENENALMQISFLNSVIVEMQNKNEVLQARLDAMLLNNEDEGTGSDVQEASTRQIAPRLFCDICDVFDLHDTEDCPVQASSDTPQQSRTVNHHAVSGSSWDSDRPYCEICEVFGHTTDECDDQQTF